MKALKVLAAPEEQRAMMVTYIGPQTRLYIYDEERRDLLGPFWPLDEVMPHGECEVDLGDKTAQVKGYVSPKPGITRVRGVDCDLRGPASVEQLPWPLGNAMSASPNAWPTRTQSDAVQQVAGCHGPKRARAEHDATSKKQKSEKCVASARKRLVGLATNLRVLAEKVDDFIVDLGPETPTEVRECE